MTQTAKELVKVTCSNISKVSGDEKVSGGEGHKLIRGANQSKGVAD